MKERLDQPWSVSALTVLLQSTTTLSSLEAQPTTNAKKRPPTGAAQSSTRTSAAQSSKRTYLGEVVQRSDEATAKADVIKMCQGHDKEWRSVLPPGSYDNRLDIWKRFPGDVTNRNTWMNYEDWLWSDAFCPVHWLADPLLNLLQLQYRLTVCGCSPSLTLSWLPSSFNPWLLKGTDCARQFVVRRVRHAQLLSFYFVAAFFFIVFCVLIFSNAFLLLLIMIWVLRVFVWSLLVFRLVCLARGGGRPEPSIARGASQTELDLHVCVCAQGPPEGSVFVGLLCAGGWHK